MRFNHFINKQFNDIKEDVLKTNSFFLKFIKNPVDGIKQIPDWRWQTILAIQLSTTVISGIFTGIVNTHIGSILIGAFILPISALIILAAATSFFYYSSVIFFQQPLDLKKLTATLVIASFPFFLFHTVSPVLPPIDLFGLAFSCLLIIISLVDSFQLPKKGVIRLVASVYLIFFLMWVFTKITTIEGGENFEPQTLDQIEKEFSFDKND